MPSKAALAIAGLLLVVSLAVGLVLRSDMTSITQKVEEVVEPGGTIELVTVTETRKAMWWLLVPVGGMVAGCGVLVIDANRRRPSS